MGDTESKGKTGLSRGALRELAGSSIRFFIHLAVLLVSAGRIWWINAWVYFGLYLLVQIIYAIIMIKKNPEVLDARGKTFREDTKTYDKVFFALWLPMIVVTLVVAGLDAVRFEWSSMHPGLAAAGVVLSIPASAFVLWAMAVNRHFEGTVRIQYDRAHEVCTLGPYRVVRHPGYAGVIITHLTAPFILGSWWALVPSAVTSILVVVRTALEDRTLQDELQGYKEYAGRVRFRLLPGIW